MGDHLRISASRSVDSPVTWMLNASRPGVVVAEAGLADDDLRHVLAELLHHVGRRDLRFIVRGEVDAGERVVGLPPCSGCGCRTFLFASR